MKPFLTPLALALALPLAAQTPDTDKRIADLERKLDILSRELESQKTGSASPIAKETGAVLEPLLVVLIGQFAVAAEAQAAFGFIEIGRASCRERVSLVV